MTSQRRTRPNLRLYSISELPEHFTMNLGTETPTSMVRPSVTPTTDEWGQVGLVVNSNVPARSRNWRSRSWDGTRQKGISRFQKEKVDTDCAICFDPAINPRRTVCCGQIFCYTHLADWLKSNKECPSCECVCISPISPSQSPSPVPRNPPPTPPPFVRPAQVSPSKSPAPISLLTRLPSMISAVNVIIGEEVGKLLMLISFILVLCIIAT